MSTQLDECVRSGQVSAAQVEAHGDEITMLCVEHPRYQPNYLNYQTLYDFAVRERINYNDLCNLVRSALLPMEAK